MAEKLKKVFFPQNVPNGVRVLPAWGSSFAGMGFEQGSLLFPKIEFFINLIFEVGVFYKHGQCSFL